MSILWDPNFASPTEPTDAFWMVQEYTTGGGIQAGSNQSTQFAPIQDPLPYFVGSMQAENECTGSPCKLTLIPPAVQPGDLLLAAVILGEKTTVLPTVPSGWTLLAASNVNSSPKYIQSYSGWWDTTWLAAHIYGTGEPNSYSFTHSSAGGELLGLMVAYRGARTNLSNYTAYGFGNNTTSPISNFSIAAISPPGETELVTFFGADSLCENPEAAEPNDVLTITGGTPALAPETTSTSPPSLFVAADAGVPTAGQLYGPYSFNEAAGCGYPGANWFAWEVAIPE